MRARAACAAWPCSFRTCTSILLPYRVTQGQEHILLVPRISFHVHRNSRLRPWGTVGYCSALTGVVDRTQRLSGTFLSDPSSSQKRSLLVFGIVWAKPRNQEYPQHRLTQGRNGQERHMPGTDKLRLSKGRVQNWERQDRRPTRFENTRQSAKHAATSRKGTTSLGDRGVNMVTQTYLLPLNEFRLRKPNRVT